MRIISDFHDFYDGYMATDQERDLLFLRKRVERFKIPPAEVPDFPVFPGSYFHGSDWPRGVGQMDQLMIGFCNSVYPVIRVWHERGEGHTLCYTLEQLEEHLERQVRPKDLDGYRANKWGRRSWPYHLRRQKFQEWFGECAQKKQAYSQVFERLAAPIFCFRLLPNWAFNHWELVVNPNLKELQFWNIFPGFQVYQELNMFLSNQAVPSAPMPPVSDQVLAEIKGFDQFSFREPKDPAKGQRKPRTRRKSS